MVVVVEEDLFVFNDTEERDPGGESGERGESTCHSALSKALIQLSNVSVDYELNPRSS